MNNNNNSNNNNNIHEIFSSFNNSHSRNKTSFLHLNNNLTYKNFMKTQKIKQLNIYRKNLNIKINELREKIEKNKYLNNLKKNYNINNNFQKFKNNNNIVPIEKSNSNFKNKNIKIENKNEKINFNLFNIIINNKKILLNYICFLNSNDLFRFIYINKNIHNLIIELFITKIKEKIINNFSNLYKNIFSDNNFYLIIKKFKKNKKLHIKILLSIKSKITENLIIKNYKNTFYQISYKTINNNNLNINTNNQNNNKNNNIKNSFEILNEFFFQIIPKNTQKNFWIIKEYTSFHYDEYERAYFSDILQFSPNEIINFNLNIFSEIGLINFNNFQWENLKIINSKKYNLNNELENLKKVWRKIDYIENNEFVKNNIIQLFENYFLIENIFFADVGYYIFKIIMTANKIGTYIGNDNNIGIKINIIAKDDILENEAKKNNLIFDEKNELNVRLNDSIIFYITQNK